ncbi:hypothetical protein GGR51DRAFT_559166 [Nemania sp. FL0031]|nr:hypothetical protein GGR51DRAFT_559166 [Nemania sp. FL0031]
MLFDKNRQEKLRARREPPKVLPPVLEEHATEFTQLVTLGTNQIISNILVVHAPTSQSDLLSINPQQIKSCSKPPDEASTARNKTSSIQISRANYPQSPVTNGNSGIHTCPCRHVDQDFKPYTCLVDKYLQEHPSYATFDEWFQHMGLHGHRWNERVYLKPSWVCVICDYNPGFYTSPQALSSYIQAFHQSESFNNDQIQAISRQSKVDKPRAWNDCLLCYFVIEEREGDVSAVLQKRRKGEAKKKGIKAARKTQNPDPQTLVGAFFEEGIGGDIRTDYADVDEESDSSDSDDLRKLPYASSKADLVSNIDKQDISNMEELMDTGIVGDPLS